MRNTKCTKSLGSRMVLRVRRPSRRHAFGHPPGHLFLFILVHKLYLRTKPREAFLGPLLGAFGAPSASPRSPTTPKRVPKAIQKTPKSDLLQDFISKPAIVSWTQYLLCFVHILSSQIFPFLDFFSFLYAPVAYKPARMPKRPCQRASGAVPTPSGHPQWPPQPPKGVPNGSQKRAK